MSDLIKKIKNRSLKELKHIYQDVFTPKKADKTVVFIIGCQRSGTTMVTKIFEKDFLIRVYGEFSKLSSQDPNKLRLNPLPTVASEISRNHAEIIVLKPLVETQNIDTLFDYFENSKAIWSYRHFKDVASSDLKLFGKRNGIDNIRPIYERSGDNWRSQRASESTTSIIRKYFSEDMSPTDAAALFWYARNILFYERNLDTNNRVHLCKYEELVISPENTMRKVYEFIGTTFPEGRIVSEVHQGSVRKGRDISLSPDVEAICEELMRRLNASYAQQEKD